MESKYPKLSSKIIALAKEDPEFRKNLLEDPRKTIQDRVKFSLPDGLKILVHEDTQNSLNIVLPYSSGELTEKELSVVTGGLGALELSCSGDTSCSCMCIR